MAGSSKETDATFGPYPDHRGLRVYSLANDALHFAAVGAALGGFHDGADELEGIVEQAMADNADAVEKIRSGNDKAIGAIVGAVMRETKGRADGGEVQRLIRERIGA